MNAVDRRPDERLVQLRTSLLSGRGPGASEQEIAEHTRNRPMLGSVPAAVERAAAAGQTDHLRAGAPVTPAPERGRTPGSTLRGAVIGATAAFVVRSIGGRLVRSPRRPRS